MWIVECSRCGEKIEKDSPSDIKTDENDNPRHDDCGYADKPEYPFTSTIKVICKYQERSILSNIFPHLTPKLESDIPLRDIVPENLQNLGNANLTYKFSIDSYDEEKVWNIQEKIIKVNGTWLVSEAPQRMYECTKCGAKFKAHSTENPVDMQHVHEDGKEWPMDVVSK